ncbi:MAG: helix-turn-helix transcriptional regulator [Dehalococcoidales bacterium]|nr:helix-turn-helix transcriptional regulator [Dehalococcoidales bacterium]
MTFGQVIVHARKSKQMSQKQLASMVIKDDGKPISPQYLNDIERDRRNPPGDNLISQFAKILDVPEDYLFFIVHEIPPKYRQTTAINPSVVHEAFEAFARSYHRSEGGKEQ